MIRHRAARWLVAATCGLTLVGCGQGTDTITTSGTANSAEPAEPVVKANGPRFFRASAAEVELAADLVPAPEPIPAELVAPWQPPSTTSTTTTAPPPPPPPPPPPAPARPAASAPRPARKAPAPAAQPSASGAPGARAEPAAPPIDTAGARVITARTNEVRASVGLAPLERDGSLDARASSWAQELANSGRLRHSSIPKSVVGSPWGTAGENVGFGPSVEVVHSALVGSSGHYANITGAAYTRIGVGVAIDGSGQTWVVQVFVG